MDILDLAQISF